jgi:hypothetical protein
VAGAVLGVVIGSADLVNLQGTAAVNPPVLPAYYALDVGEVQNWLTAAYPDEADTLLSAVTTVAGLAYAEEFAPAFEAAEPDVQLVTERAFQSLTGLVPDPALAAPPTTPPGPLVDSVADGDFSTCLGIDSNPYAPSGPAVYLAVELPDNQLTQIPEAWDAFRLDVSKEGELFWQLLACQQATGGTAERSR